MVFHHNIWNMYLPVLQFRTVSNDSTLVMEIWNATYQLPCQKYQMQEPFLVRNKIVVHLILLVPSTGAPDGSGGTLTYVWQSSPDDAAWSDIGSSDNVTYDVDSTSTDTYYRRGAYRCASGGTQYTSSLLIDVVTAPNAGTLSGTQAINPTSVVTVTSDGDAGEFMVIKQRFCDYRCTTGVAGRSDSGRFFHHNLYGIGITMYGCHCYNCINGFK